MAKYRIKQDMGFSGTESDFEEIEIPDDEDPENNEEIQAAMSEAYDDALSSISVWYELADDE